MIGLSVGYRIPQQIMNLANRVMAAGTRLALQILCVRAIQSAHHLDVRPVLVVAEEARRLSDELASGSVAVVATDDRCDEISAALRRRC